MTLRIRKIFSYGVAAILLGTSVFTLADPVERVVAIDVENPRAQLAAMDQLFSSDVMRGQKATLWAPMFSGSSRANRTLVIEFDSFEAMAARDQSVRGSADWMAFQSAVEGTSEVVGNRMAVQRIVDGSGWSNHGALVAFTMTVSDPATYAAAFSELIEAMDNPGSVRLMEMRFGGEGTTHVALISAQDATAANQYVDELQGSAAYREFVGKVGDIRKINNISLLRRVRSWGNSGLLSGCGRGLWTRPTTAYATPS